MNRNRQATERRLAFARELFAGRSAPDAARAAGYKGSAATLSRTACRLRQRPDVATEIERLRAEHEAQAVASRDEALRVLTEHLRASPLDFMTTDGAIDLEKARLAGRTSALKKITIREESGKNSSATTVTVQLEDKQGAVDRLAKLLDWYAPERHKHSFEGKSPAEVLLGLSLPDLLALEKRLATEARSHGEGQIDGK